MTTATQEPAAQAAAQAAKSGKGLEDVVAAQSAISDVDGKTGILLYRGYAVADLAEHAGYEETAHLLLEGKLPNKAELAAFKKDLASHRDLPAPVVDALRKLPKSASTMSALRTGISMLAAFDPDGDDMAQVTKTDKSRLDREKKKVRRLVAQLPAVAATFHRIKNGLDPVPADPSLSHAADFLHRVLGRKPTADEERCFDLCLVIHAEHGLNASTFACRVTVATLSDIHSGIVSGIGALKGPLHGGANEEVMKMLESIGSVERVTGWIQDALANGKKVMGMGHRVYKVYDPRARILKEWSKRLGEQKGEPHWFQMSEIIEKAVNAQKPNIHPNVDFYSATVYRHLGIPAELFTPIFAVSRVAGWCAHALEQLADNRLIRPESDYIGPTGLKVVPIDQRP
jgi:citrate synthase